MLYFRFGKKDLLRKNHEVCYLYNKEMRPETHIRRTGGTARPPSQLAVDDGDKLSEIVYSEGKIFCTGRLEQPRQDKNILYQPSEPNKPTKEDPLYFLSLPHFQHPASTSPL
jgi:hypothetical protein